jgi:hypothetical protein
MTNKENFFLAVIFFISITMVFVGIRVDSLMWVLGYTAIALFILIVFIADYFDGGRGEKI